MHKKIAPRTHTRAVMPWLALLAACAAVLLAACGGDGTPDATGTATTAAGTGTPTGTDATTPAATSSEGGGKLACGLFTQQEAEAALGEPPGDVHEAALSGVTTCAFQPSSDRGILVNISRGVSRADFDRTVQQNAQLLGQQPTPVNAGDAAAWFYPYLLMLKDDVFVRLSVWSPMLGVDDTLARATTLAVQAASRI